MCAVLFATASPIPPAAWAAGDPAPPAVATPAAPGDPPVTAQGGVCSPPALGAPCATGGITTQGAAEPAPSLLLGNPVHLATGNKYQLDVDLPANPASPGLELVRHYNGLATGGGALGRNWTLSYDTQLIRRGQGWLVRQADGSTRPIPTPRVSGKDSVWQWPDGRELHFDEAGRLTRIRAGGATLARIHRHAGRDRRNGLIRRIEGAAGHALDFHYEERHGELLVAAVDTPLGRFRYRHEAPAATSGHRAPRLVAVERPDGMARLYHYEPELQAGNPYALTGISLRAGKGAAHRLATWKYDHHGRVIELHRHGQRQPVLHVEYLRRAAGDRAGVTRVSSSTGRQQLVSFRRRGNEYVLLDRHDAGDTAGSPAIVHDAAGRLAAIGGLTLQWGENGLRGVQPHAPGWPGLSLHYEHLPFPPRRRYGWQTRATGLSTVVADANGLPARLRYANGDTQHMVRDPQGRPVQITETGGESLSNSVTRLQWRGVHLVKVEHPAETETRHHDEHGRVIARVIQRPAAGSSPAAEFRESFRYDAHGRLLRHDLPEGGALHYTWREEHSRRHTLAAMHWEDAQGRRHLVVASSESAPGYRYGNGLQVVSGAVSGSHADSLRLSDGRHDVWLQHRHYDAGGRVVADLHDFPHVGHHDRLYFVHDEASRLQGARHERPDVAERWWFAWHDDGSLAALDISGATRQPAIHRDPAGQPSRAGALDVRYGPGRRLEAVTQVDSGRLLARYRHNAFGHVVSAEHPAAHVAFAELPAAHVHFLRIDGQVAAEAHSVDGVSPSRVTRRYLRAGLTPVGMIEYQRGAPPRLYAVHADLSGAPRMLTDEDRRLRWLATYTPTGAATKVAGDIDFPLRLPGQYEDEATGWHDNVLRTFDPMFGHYLEPDPLGPLPGTDVYGYAAQQPWRYADPDGLLLFAFDGTRQSADTMGNVWKLAQAYRDGAAHYHSGPGNSHFLDWDAIVAWRAGRILENQWQALLTAVEHQAPGTALSVDVIGFSRGAALARHFGNRVADHVRNGVFSVTDPVRGQISACVDLRFMGLFDTVAQFGVGGSHNHLYDFGISELWSWVSHAVALHEHRWAFPLTSADAGSAGNVVEAPFVGAHADIGGGLALHAPPARSAGPGGEAPGAAAETESDLADVALAWMHWQALAASVGFDTLAASDSEVTSPLLRDMRAPLLRTLQRGDRAVQAPSGASRHSYQDDDSRLGANARGQVEGFISRMENWRSRAGEHVGTVDMTGYAQWLEQTLGWPVK